MTIIFAKQTTTDILRKCSLIFISYFLLLIILVPETSFASNATTVITLNTTGKAPLNDDNMRGFMDLIANEAFSRIGITLKTVALPAERGLLNANTGKIDGEMSRIAGIQKTYQNLIQIPEKIMDWEFVAIGKPNLRAENGWQSFEGKQLAFINGWKILENNITPLAKVTKVKGADSLFRLLKIRRIDFVIYERWAAAKYIRDLSIANVSIHLPALAKREMFIYIHKKHNKLIEKLATALRGMKLDGTYEKIKNQTLKQYINP